MRENFQITDSKTGKVYWISRAIAVTGVIMALDSEDNLWFLLERRGPGCPDNVGKLCSVCGYLNWDETRLDAVLRETYEETGLKISPIHVKEFQTIDDPGRDAKQNVVTRYLIVYDYDTLKENLDSGVINTDTFSRGGEKDEVSEFLLLELKDIIEMDSDEFAFGHREMIIDILQELEDD